MSRTKRNVPGGRTLRHPRGAVRALRAGVRPGARPPDARADKGIAALAEKPRR